MSIKRTLVAVDADDLRGTANKLLDWLRKVQDGSNAKTVKGGAGSGFHGPRRGRPGQRGGSMPREAGYREQLPELREKWDKDDISLLRKMLDEFGFTYHPIDGSSPTSGYALSPYRNRERVLDIDQVSADSLEQYLIDNEDIWVRPDHYFGAWYNTEDGKVYLDVSIVAKTTEQAERLSVRHKQEAYYDLAAGQTVYVRARGDEAGKAFDAQVELELIELARLRSLY